MNTTGSARPGPLGTTGSRRWTCDSTAPCYNARNDASHPLDRAASYGRKTPALVMTEALVMAAARPVPGTTADAKVWRDSDLVEHCRGVTVLGDGADINTGLVVPHCRRSGLPLLKGEEQDSAAHRKVRARVEHVFSQMKNYRILRACRRSRPVM
ncbi:transposase family protein [Streptomyces sp. NPDC127197]|uniref:transposase family protein n=1 Tax=Streptomyces sp. NPDC127197 TaxID=3345388 RepID=UPI00363BA768